MKWKRLQFKLLLFEPSLYSIKKIVLLMRGRNEHNIAIMQFPV